MRKWIRGSQDENTKIGHFKLKEFECSCGCKEQQIDMELIERLNAVREQLKGPIAISSGYRCANKQAQLRAAGYETAKGVSQHELGRAADIVTDLRKHAQLLSILEEEFNAIGIGKSFYHVDLRDDKHRYWSYR
jgi:uncharacterized protein YcbK (DUF882 family)